MMTASEMNNDHNLNLECAVPPVGYSSSTDLEDFEMHGWIPDSRLSDDENYMDMVMLVTRNSHCKQGSMACALVGLSSPSKKSNLLHSVISVSTNQALYSDNDSDIHAEIVALCSAARRGQPTANATAYITMPPCKRCFAALLSAGIKRIVTRLAFPEKIEKVAEKNGIQVVALGGIQEQRARINLLIYGNPNGSGKRGHEMQSHVADKCKRSKEGDSETEILSKSFEHGSIC